MRYYPIYRPEIPDAIRMLSNQVPIETKRKVYLATRQMNFDIASASFRAEMNGKRRWPEVVAELNRISTRVNEVKDRYLASLTPKEREILAKRQKQIAELTPKELEDMHDELVKEGVLVTPKELEDMHDELVKEGVLGLDN